MALIVLQEIKKAFSGNTVLDGARLVLNPGEKVGLVGRNGCGKTTLIKLAAGIMEPDAGERTVSGNPSFGYLAQEADFGGRASVLEAASHAQTELNELETDLARLSSAMEKASDDPLRLEGLIKRHERLEERYRMKGGYARQGKVEAVLKGVGFKAAEFSNAPTQLSGGEAKRLQLAMVLLGGHDVLFLDEPGNHLDMGGTEWLTDFLRDSKSTVLLVSHDRYLLNGVVDRIVELDEGRTYTYKGDCDFFLAERAKRIEALAKERTLQEKQIARGEEFIRRNFYGQKARLAKSKRKMLDRLEAVHVRRTPPLARFRFKEAPCRFDHVLRLEKAGTRLGNRTLFENLDMELSTGERLGVIGPNGSGKSTLLKNILGLEPLTKGDVWMSPLARYAYLDQELKNLGSSGNLLDMLRAVDPRATDGMLRSHLACFLFRGEEAEKNLKDLSGGERSRALLARLTLQESNLLLLDEPTNHLDIYTRQALEEALLGFPGAVVAVSHDRHLLDGVADKLLVLGGPTPLLHSGSYSSYAARIKAEDSTRSMDKSQKSRRRSSTRNKAPLSRGVKRRHTYEELEAMIIQKEDRLKEIEKEVYKEEGYMDAERSRALQEESVKLREKLNDLYKEWETWA
jgi:ATP-binding cassette subfamily F protein 3